MKKLIWLLIIVPGMALAEHDNFNHNHNDIDAEADANAEANANNSVDTSNQVDASSAADVTTGDTNVSIEGDNTFYDFPSNSAYAPNGLSHISCDQLLGAGYTNVNGSGSLGVPIPRWLSGKIRDCEANADATWLAEMGLTQAAVEARCSTRSMRGRFGGKAKGKDKQVDACVRAIGGMVGGSSGAGRAEASSTKALQEAQEQQRNEVRLLRAQLASLEGMQGYDDAELRRRLAVLEPAAHMPGSSAPIVHQD